MCGNGLFLFHSDIQIKYSEIVREFKSKTACALIKKTICFGTCSWFFCLVSITLEIAHNSTAKPMHNNHSQEHNLWIYGYWVAIRRWSLAQV